MSNGHAVNDWMAELDWSIHGRKSRGFFSEHTFLAVVLERIAQLATGEYPVEFPYFLAEAGRRPVGEFVYAEQAFTPEGKRTNLYAPALASTIGFSHEFKVPIADTANVTPQEWANIQDDAMWTMSCGEGARFIWMQLAPLFAKLASSGRIRTFIEPIDGGANPVPLDRQLWRIPPDAAVRRCASCGINDQEPLNHKAKPTHFIYVDDHDLKKVIEEAAHANYIALIEPDMQLMRLIDGHDPSTHLKRLFLTQLMTEARSVLSLDEMKSELSKRFSTNIGDREMAKLRRAVLDARPNLKPDYERTGPRRKTRTGTD